MTDTDITTSNIIHWRGTDLGTHTVAYTERDVIIYALAVGAAATELDLVFEERLRVLPTFALTLAQWAPDELGSRGAFDTTTALHGSQQLTIFSPLPTSGEIAMKASVAEVWDKGTAAVFEVLVESKYFAATWSIFAPGYGGYGGERGQSERRTHFGEPEIVTELATSENQAALCRLLGDRHHIHIVPEAANRIGQPRPIMHGLCTLAASTLPLARERGAHPADLLELSARFTAPAFPGQALPIHGWRDGDTIGFTVGNAISGGRARFSN